MVRSVDASRVKYYVLLSSVMTVMPIFLRGPSDLVVIEHEDASFSAAINGKPEPKVQW